ncbi:uncharacterized protein H6S33_002808 [Morchella sextelata]|uniref:uncharacterized protein n=1 Tax=Morchella sextelata TaxID=1174677 RepID=UPI001D058D75|nr:uncharacterized protein H6S33_002808 [Morchella sextelata]KAH0607774.1 hypothetical protein H6S33_002808 [Morchella sextelata]
MAKGTGCFVSHFRRKQSSNAISSKIPDSLPPLPQVDCQNLAQSQGVKGKLSNLVPGTGKIGPSVEGEGFSEMNNGTEMSGRASRSGNYIRRWHSNHSDQEPN